MDSGKWVCAAMAQCGLNGGDLGRSRVFYSWELDEGNARSTYKL